jgi:hypothetical protein
MATCDQEVPLVERSILKPSSLEELSTHDRTIFCPATALADRLLGAAGAVGGVGAAGVVTGGEVE